MFNYAKGSTEQTVNAGIQEAGRGNHAAGATELSIERRGHGGKGCPPKQLPKETEEDLLAEVQRLRAENDYLKNLQALVLEDERRQRKKRWEFKS